MSNKLPVITIIEVSPPHGPAPDAALLQACEPVHRELRPQLPQSYAQRMQEIFKAGAGMICATRDGVVLGVAVYRYLENTFEGRKLYVDDLVTTATQRSSGVGRTMINWLEQAARSQHCSTLALDSGVQRGAAHRFYFREGFVIPSFSFRKPLSK